MDTILSKQVFLIDDFTVEEELFEEEKISVWVTDKDRILPSTSLSLSSKLEPGIYEVGYSKDQGFFCKKSAIINDELFIFSNSLTQNLLKEIELFWSKKDLYAKKNFLHKRGIFLEGYPGTGKTSLISQISEGVISAGGVIFKIKDFRNLVDYVEFITDYFRKIQPETPVITIIEDLDKYMEVESELLDFLDGKTNINHHIVIATSNNTEEIPETLLRPSRFDIKIEIPLPDEITREEYFRFKEVEEEKIVDLVKLTDKLSLADLKEIYICIYFLDYTVENAIRKVKSPKSRKNYSFGSPRTSKIGFSSDN